MLIRYGSPRLVARDDFYDLCCFNYFIFFDNIIMTQKITPHLWFDNNLAEAMDYYCKVFPNSKIIMKKEYKNSWPDGKTDVLVWEFELMWQRVMWVNWGPYFKLTEAFSFVIDCQDQAEVDYYWNTFVNDWGEESQCWRCKDKFGLSRQVTPKQLNIFLDDPDSEKANRVMQAMLSMKKIIISDLEKAYDWE